jgi:hypothetical protein
VAEEEVSDGIDHRIEPVVIDTIVPTARREKGKRKAGGSSVERPAVGEETPRCSFSYQTTNDKPPYSTVLKHHRVTT